MARRLAAGLLMYRVVDGKLQVFIVHPGGPLFARKDAGHWTIPKGEPDDHEKDLLAAAEREFLEETGLRPVAPYHALGSITQKGGKEVHAWAFRWPGPGDPAGMRSNTFRMQWPPGSGREKEFPEVDRWEFLDVQEARLRLKETQWPLVERLLAWSGWRA